MTASVLGLQLTGVTLGVLVVLSTWLVSRVACHLCRADPPGFSEVFLALGAIAAVAAMTAGAFGGP